MGGQAFGADWLNGLSEDMSQSNHTLLSNGQSCHERRSLSRGHSQFVPLDPVIDFGVSPTELDIGRDIGSAFNGGFDFSDEWLSEHSAPAYSSTSSSTSLEDIEVSLGDSRAIDTLHVQPAILFPPPSPNKTARSEHTNVLSTTWWLEHSQSHGAQPSSGQSIS